MPLYVVQLAHLGTLCFQVIFLAPVGYKIIWYCCNFKDNNILALNHLLLLTHILRLPLYTEEGEMISRDSFVKMKKIKGDFSRHHLLSLLMISICSAFLMSFLLVLSRFEAYPLPIEIFANCGSWPISKATLTQVFLDLVAIWKLSTGPMLHSLLGPKLRLDTWSPDSQFSALSIVPHPQSLFVWNNGRYYTLRGKVKEKFTL